MRMTRAQRIASSAEADATVISNGTSPFLDPVFWYVTGQTSGTFEGSFAVISGDGGLDVITSGLEETAARKASGNVHVYEKREERDSLLAELLKGCARIGVNGGSIVHNAAEHLRKITGAGMTDVSKNIAAVMAVKDAKEISEIRKACEISSRTAERIPELLYAGMTEKEAAWLIDSDMRMNGGDGNAFETIAAFGKNSAEPHHRPGNAVLKKGDTALFDFGSKCGMYCSDLTRTVFFGDPEDILRRAYGTVSKAQEAGMKEMYDGAPAKDAHNAASEIIDAGGFKDMFIHSFGQGLGMNIHESPSVSHMSGDILREGMTVSAEPGIYVKGKGGIRIEDTVLITKNGPERLTKFSKDITVI